jgi:hypothetical protein
MRLDPHQYARFLIDQKLLTVLSQEEQQWLGRHVEDCAPCDEYGELSARIVQGLNSFSFEVDPKMSARVLKAVTTHARQLTAEEPTQGRLQAQRLRWVLGAAAALLLAASLFYRNTRHGDEAEKADALLLDRVNVGVSRAVPEIMEPLMQPASLGSRSAESESGRMDKPGQGEAR